MKKQFLAIAVSAGMLVSGLASAEIDNKESQEESVTVTYSARLAASEAGFAELKRKIRRAAEQVCGPQNRRRAGTLSQWADNRQCYDSAVASALKAVSTSPAIAAVSRPRNDS
jgi:UrcA family protein